MVDRIRKSMLFLKSRNGRWGGREGGRRIDSTVEKDVARTLTNRKGDVSCVVEREEDLCYEPDSLGADSRYRYMTRYKFYHTPFATPLLLLLFYLPPLLSPSDELRDRVVEFQRVNFDFTFEIRELIDPHDKFLFTRSINFQLADHLSKRRTYPIQLRQ